LPSTFAKKGGVPPAAPAKKSFEFTAYASGEQEVPPVSTLTSGELNLQFSESFDFVEYTLNVYDGVAVTQAHLHCALPGSNGAVVVTIFNAGVPVEGPGGLDVDGTLSDGEILNSDITSTACGGFTVNNVASLYWAIKQGLIYLNVHTEGSPSGVIRAQIFP
jgi:hypothetical protein